MTRQRGAAGVEEHPAGSGRYRVRARINGTRKVIASGLPKAEAEETANAYQLLRSEADLREGVTLTQFGAGFLDRRERAGIRGIRSDRNRWSLYIDRDPIGGLPVSTLRRRDVLEWLDRRSGLSAQTRKNAINLLRVALQEAVDRELLEQNPARDVRVHRAASASGDDKLSGILSPAEQQALVAAIPERYRSLVVFALCTGLRQAEQWWLMWNDLVLDGSEAVRVVVSRSVGGLAPKAGKPRVVELLPPARAAIASLRRRCQWVFPATRGGRRQQGKPPRHWRRWLLAAGITRRVRWHDLRHTCATSLLAGWWGRKWSLDEVCEFMGHSSVQVTERYARKLRETQRLAVSETPGLAFNTGPALPQKPVANSRPQGGARGEVNLLNAQGNDDAFLNRWSAVRLCPGAQADSRSGGGQSGANTLRRYPEHGADVWALTLAAERLLQGRR